MGKFALAPHLPHISQIVAVVPFGTWSSVDRWSRRRSRGSDGPLPPLARTARPHNGSEVPSESSGPPRSADLATTDLLVVLTTEIRRTLERHQVRLREPKHRSAPQLGGPNWGVPRTGTFAGLGALQQAMRGGPRMARLNRSTGPSGSEPAPAWPAMAQKIIIWTLFANMEKSVSSCSVVAVLGG